MLNQKRYDEVRVVELLNFMLAQCKSERVSFDEFRIGFSTAKDYSSRWRVAGKYIVANFTMCELERAMLFMIPADELLGGDWARVTGCGLAASDTFGLVTDIKVHA